MRTCLGLLLALASAMAVAAEPPELALQQVEQSLAELERDLLILEEDLLYPPSSRVAVFLSLDVGALLSLQEVEVKLNGDTVAHHLYTERQVDALARGGVQQLYVGNARQGDNEVTAFFLGHDAQEREVRHAASLRFTKSFEPMYLQLRIADSTTLQRPELSIEAH
jgi:hypothetical protein